MPNYILRDIDPGLWARLKARAVADGMSLKAVFLALLERYASGDITLKQ